MKRFVYWNNYQTISEKVINNNTNIYESISTLFQGVKVLFALAYDATDDNNNNNNNDNNNNEAGIRNNKKYFLLKKDWE